MSISKDPAATSKTTNINKLQSKISSSVFDPESEKKLQGTESIANDWPIADLMRFNPLGF